MKVLVCENNSSGTSSPFMVTDCLGESFTGLTSQTACLRKSVKMRICRPRGGQGRQPVAPDKTTGCPEKLI